MTNRWVEGLFAFFGLLLCVPVFVFAADAENINPQKTPKKEIGIDIPAENLVKGTLPTMKIAEASEGLAKRLLEAIASDNPESVRDLFFPPEPFDILKDIKRPRDYHTKLVGWFIADIHREHSRLKEDVKIEFDRFTPGSCRWKPIGTEYNKIAYWSCSRNSIFVKAGTEKITIKVVSMINWGKNWYVTHLGPIPAE